MAKQKKKKKTPKRDKVRPRMPVDKPNNSHMPLCNTVGCNRHVSDARKSVCSVCGASKTITYANDYDLYSFYE